MRKEERGEKSQEAGRPQESVALERRHGQPAPRWERQQRLLWTNLQKQKCPKQPANYSLQPLSPSALFYSNPHTHKGMSVFPCWEDFAPTGTGMRMNQISVFSDPKNGSANTVWQSHPRQGTSARGPGDHARTSGLITNHHT